MIFMKKSAIVVCDFDGTITKEDSINKFLEKFADKKWLEVEEEWVNGKISTCIAMTAQFEMIKDMTEKKLEEYFNSVEVDDYFKEFCKICREKNIDIAVVSDGLKFFIDRIFQINEIKDIPVFSNKAEFINNKFQIEFPHKIDDCRNKSGTCKCKFVQEFKKDYNKIIYVGDGVSDYCVADKADVLFAKKRLMLYCKKEKIPFIKYDNFRKVIDYVTANRS